MNSWIDLHQYIPEIKGSIIHVLSTPINEFSSLLETLGFRVFVIDGSKIIDEATFFDEFARVLEFPAYFGHNWGAWDDSLGEFIHSIPERVAIVWQSADKSFANDPQSFLQVICDLYNIAASVTLKYSSLNRVEGKQVEVFILIQDILKII